MRRIFHRCMLPAIVALAFAPALHAVEITAERTEFFEKNIRPVLVAECYDCHAGEKQKGGLRLDDRDSLIKGGDNGALIIPGDADNSLLIQSLAHTHADKDVWMPKNGAKLDGATLQHFIEWVKMGAPDPRTGPVVAHDSSGSWEHAFELRKKWWSLQPITKHNVTPNVPAQNPVDTFVFAKLAEKGIPVATAADRRTALRRLSFALNGLPPSASEMDAFLNDSSPQAWDRMVDHYLSLPAFGETWSRHWMDLMRYADTHGSEGDPEIPYAWRYRDYLIRSLNADISYDKLVREHVAGDLIEPRWNEELGINEALLGTANLRLLEHGFQPVDSLDEQVKMVDNQIDVLTKSFLGLTVSCARCHDHKFDAISHKDYYALYGILASTRPGQVTLDSPERLALHRDELLRLKAEIKTGLADVWLEEADKIPARLGAKPQVNSNEKLIELQLAAYYDQARSWLQTSTGKTSPAGLLPSPMARWSFESDARDSIGNLNGELVDGAFIRQGRLILDGKRSFVQTAELSKSVKTKTLEAWVSLDNVEQQGGGVITVESNRGAIFDSMVFGEAKKQEWIAGSNHFARSKRVEGALETTPPGKLVHLAVVYGENNEVQLYRNGEPYGETYVAAKPFVEFEPMESRVLLGRRHTGGGRAFFAGEIEETRLYDQALTREDVALSYQTGYQITGNDALLAAMGNFERQEVLRLSAELQRFKSEPPTPAEKLSENWKKALADSLRDPDSPLYPWMKLRGKRPSEYERHWKDLVAVWETKWKENQQFNRDHFVTLWDLTGVDYDDWFKMGNGLPKRPSESGEFVVGLSDDTVVDRILPAGIYSDLLSSKHNGLLTSPRFEMVADHVSFLMAGDHGGGLRIIIDNYPLGNNDTYPQIRMDGESMRWMKRDTSYRKGANSYLELATFDDLTRPQRGNKEEAEKGKSKVKDVSNGRSWFGIAKIVMHKDTTEIPREENVAVALLFKGAAPVSSDELALQMVARLREVLLAWKSGKMSVDQQRFLDYFVSKGLLPNQLEQLPELALKVKKYRDVEALVPVPQRAPGPIEADGFDAPLLVRGEHLHPGELVPRRFLEALGGAAVQETAFKSARVLEDRDARVSATTFGSGREQLAEAMTSSQNPLFARVMVNRIWHWLYGKGLVGTVDNFGRLGDKPSHPELLDYLAQRFIDEGYSIKKMVRLLVTSEAWRFSSDSTDEAINKDAANEFFGRARVRRLDAEMIRDAILQVADSLNPEMYGPSTSESPRRRSVYLEERRSRANAFLEVFDRPKPMTTRGQRDSTNIPAQSLTMMNSNFVIGMAERWAKKIDSKLGSVQDKLKDVYTGAFGRLPSKEEVSEAENYFGESQDLQTWRDYLQAMFALKEFIYLR